ncbi:unnamed protein product [Penicillium salamii]|nr:unnamed protein product [Penicillium salamii]
MPSSSITIPSSPSSNLESASLLEHTEHAGLTRIPLDAIPLGAVIGRSHSNESSITISPTISSSLDTTNGDLLVGDTLPRFAAIEFLRQWFPEIDPEDPRTKTFSRKLSNRDVALVIHQFLAGVVLIFNIIVTALAIHTSDPVNRKAGIIDVAGVTNCDQLLVAPTRKDIEEAHNKRRTLDVGIQSFRNLRSVDTRRRVLWVLLMLSSGLLHLFWNTVVFAASPKVSYNVGVVTSDYLKDSTTWSYSMAGFDELRRNATNLAPLSRAACIERYTNTDNGLSDVLLVARNISKHDQMSFAIDNSSTLLSNFSAFEAATDGDGSKGIRWAQANSWVCSAWTPLGYYALPPNSERVTICSASAMKAYVDSWTFTRWEKAPGSPSGVQLSAGVDHCIPASEPHPTEDICALRVSYTLLIIVCGLNLIKLICIFCTARLHRSNRFSVGHEGVTEAKTAYLVTVGDAIASFLEYEDDHTKDLSLATRSDFSRGKWPVKGQGNQKSELVAKLRVRRWFSAVSILQWTSTLLLCAGFMIFTSVELGQSLTARKSGGLAIDLPSLWSYGIGTAHAWSISLTGTLSHMNQEVGFFFATIYVNIFQILVSGLYLLCNNIITVILMASEWNSYCSQRRSLRVSCPRGYQRSTYFLSLPYRYSLPLMAASSVLHWLVSQSIFVIQTIAYQTPGFDRAPDLDGSLVGTSPIAMFLAVLVGGVMIFTMLAFAIFSKYKPSPTNVNGTPSYPAPLVGTCSAAISAACHAHPEDRDPALLPIRWGYVRDDLGHSKGRFRFSTARDLI